MSSESLKIDLDKIAQTIIDHPVNSEWSTDDADTDTKQHLAAILKPTPLAKQRLAALLNPSQN